MRDFRDAKVMAHALRDALKARAVEITHSESLELIANTFGFANWNIMSAKIEAAFARWRTGISTTKNSQLLLLWQEPARGEEAYRWADCVHLRRVRRAVRE